MWACLHAAFAVSNVHAFQGGGLQGGGASSAVALSDLQALLSHLF